MNEIKLAHIALQYSDKEKAEIFFEKVLGLTKEREFTLLAEIGEQIFGIKREVEVKVYSNDNVRVEIFITSEKPKITYEHICLLVPSKEELISRCKTYGVETILMKRNEKEILFLRDFSGYLYEIKES